MSLNWIISSPEIEARPEMESDKKLDKLESFLGRLNSKGLSFNHYSKLIFLLKCCRHVQSL